MEKQQDEEIEIDLLELFGVLRARWFSILMTGVILAAVFGIGTILLITPKYQSTSKLYIVGQTSTLTSLTDLQVGTQLTQDYMVLVQSRPVLETVIQNLNLDMEYEQIKSMVSLENQSDTRILDITVVTDDPYMAKEIVDEISEVSVSRIAAIMNVDEPTTVEYGHLEDSPSSPNTKKNIAIGGILGIVLSAGLVIVMYLLNDTISTEEDVEKYLGLNNLGMIPMDEGAMEQILRDRRKRKGETGGILKRIFPEKHRQKG
jgi:capsular polysaccharide biosynthesis protein